MLKYRRIVVALGLLSLIAVGCGDDDAQSAPSHESDADSGGQQEADAGGDVGDEDASDAPDAEAEPASIRVEPRQIIFEGVEIGEPASATISIRNVGGSDLYVTDASVTQSSSQADDEEFKPGDAWVEDDQLAIEPGTHTNIEVVYDPVDHTVDRGFVTIRSTDPENPEIVVSLATVNAYPDIDVPKTVRYGSVDAGESVTEEIVIYNRGLMGLTVDDISIQSTEGDDAFSYVMQEPYELPALIDHGDYVIFEATFAPTSTDTSRATLTIESDDPDEPSFEMGLVGNEPTPCIRVDKTHLDFGSTTVGDESTENLTIVNCSRTRQLEVSGISLSTDGGGAFDISQAPETPATLSPMTTEQLEVTASSDAARDASGILVIESNDPEQGSVVVNVRATFDE